MARQNFIGLVISQGKMNKTVKVRVQQTMYNSKIMKSLITQRNYLVHDEGNICKEGDLVRIESTRPLSPKKFFAVAEIKKNVGQQFEKYEKEAKENVDQQEAVLTREFLIKRNDRISGKSTTVQDLLRIEQLALNTNTKISAKEVEEITQLKAKYGITSWPPQKRVVKLDLEVLREKVNALRKDINTLDLLSQVMQKQDQVEIILKQMGHENDNLKESVKKNIVRKYLRNAENSELQRLSV